MFVNEGEALRSTDDFNPEPEFGRRLPQRHRKRPPQISPNLPNSPNSPMLPIALISPMSRKPVVTVADDANRRLDRPEHKTIQLIRKRLQSPQKTSSVVGSGAEDDLITSGSAALQVFTSTTAIPSSDLQEKNSQQSEVPQEPEEPEESAQENSAKSIEIEELKEAEEPEETTELEELEIVAETEQPEVVEIPPLPVTAATVTTSSSVNPSIAVPLTTAATLLTRASDVIVHLPVWRIRLENLRLESIRRKNALATTSTTSTTTQSPTTTGATIATLLIIIHYFH